MKEVLNVWSQKTSSLFIVLALLCVPLVYSSKVPDPSLTPRIFALSLLVTLYFIFLLFSRKPHPLFKSIHAFRQPLTLFYLGYLFIAGISLLWAINQQEAIFEWSKSALFFLFLFTIYRAFKQSKDPALLTTKSIVLLALVLSVRGFYEVVSVSESMLFDHQASYFIRAWSSNRNLFSQFLVLCLPFTGYGVYRLRKGWRLIALLASFSIFILSVILLTRSVWLALFCASALAGLLVLIKGKFEQGLRKQFKRVLMFLFIGLGILFLALVIYAQFGDLKIFHEQLYWLSNYRFGSSLERIELWRNSMLMFKDHVLEGVGSGNWKILFPTYGFSSVRPDAATTFFQRPHNDFIWVLTELGIFGFLCYSSIFIFGIRNLFKALWRAKNNETYYFILALLSGFTAYLVFAMLSFPKERVEHQMMLHVYLVFSILLYPKKKEKKTFHQKIYTYPVILVFILALSSLPMSLCRLQAEQHVLKAYQYRSQYQYERVVSEIDQSDGCLTVDTYSTPLDWYRGEANFLLGKNDQALKDFEKAFRFHPYHIYVLNNLGTSYELSGKRSKAKSLYLDALNIYPQYEDALLNLTALYFNEEELDAALIMLSRIAEDSENQRYAEYKKVVLTKKLNGMMLYEEHDQIFKKSIERIRNDYKWSYKVYKQAYQLQHDFESEVYREIVFLLESVDSTITAVQAQNYRDKYNLLPYE